MKNVTTREALNLTATEVKDGRSGVLLWGGRGTRKHPLKKPVRVLPVEQAQGVVAWMTEDRSSVVDHTRNGSPVWVAVAPPEFGKILTREELLALVRAVPVSAHDADESGVTFEMVNGRAAGHGFWPDREDGQKPYGSILEAHIVIKQHGVKVGAVNVAWLFDAATDAAWADKQAKENTQ